MRSFSFFFQTGFVSDITDDETDVLIPYNYCKKFRYPSVYLQFSISVFHVSFYHVMFSILPTSTALSKAYMSVSLLTFPLHLTCH